jgi:hypothetical protein
VLINFLVECRHGDDHGWWIHGLERGPEKKSELPSFGKKKKHEESSLGSRDTFFFLLHTPPQTPKEPSYLPVFLPPSPLPGIQIKDLS